MTSLIVVAITVGFNFAIAFLPSNPAPITISANGDVITARLLTVLSIIFGNVTSKYDRIIPAKILRMIGFLHIPTIDFLIFLLLEDESLADAILGHSKVNTITAKTL